MTAAPASLPTITINQNTRYAGQGNPSRSQITGFHMHVPSRTDLRRDFGCPHVNHKKLCRLLWLAFPSRSEAELSERASLYLGVTDRTIRNYLAGTHRPKWDTICLIAGLVGWEAFLGILFGARN
jgi:hypothetical protein